MAVLPIKKYPDDVLKKNAEPVETFDGELQQLIDDMIETMYSASGVGLAAPQVGASCRLIVVDTTLPDDTKKSELIVLCNPEVIEAEGSVESEEGCLSIPGFQTKVTRAERVTVKGKGRDGADVTIPAEGLLAIALQHEIDHLDGTLLLDRTSFLKREFYKKQLKKSLAREKVV